MCTWYCYDFSKVHIQSYSKKWRLVCSANKMSYMWQAANSYPVLEQERQLACTVSRVGKEMAFTQLGIRGFMPCSMAVTLWSYSDPIQGIELGGAAQCNANLVERGIRIQPKSPRSVLTPSCAWSAHHSLQSPVLSNLGHCKLTCASLDLAQGGQCVFS